MRRTLTSDRGLLPLAAVLVIAIVLWAWLARGTLFYFDEWTFRSDPFVGGLFEGYNGQPSLVPKLVWAIVQAIFGAGSLTPFRITWYLLMAGTLAGVYALLRPRLGWPVPVLAIAVLCVLGVLESDLAVLMPITGLYFVLPLGWFVWALVALERGKDAVACVLLVLCIFTSSSGLPPVIGVALWLVWSPAQWRRLWVAAVPVVLFALWWLAIRPEQITPITREDFARIPAYIFEGTSFGATGLIGTAFDWGQIFGVLLIVAVVALIARGTPISRPAIAMVGAAAAFWALLSIGRGPEWHPDEPRYVWADAAYVLLAVLLLAAGTTGAAAVWRWRTVGIAAIVAVCCAFPNLEAFRDHALDWRNESQVARAQLTALDRLAFDQGRTADPGYSPLFRTRRGEPLRARRYMLDLRKGRDPVGFSEAEAAKLSESRRGWIDRTTLEALDVHPQAYTGPTPKAGPAPATVEPPVGAVTTAGPCLTARPGPTASVTVALPQPITIKALGDAPAEVRLRRYARVTDPARPAIGAVAPGPQGIVGPPKDKSKRPWQATVTSAGPFRICAVS